MLQNLHFMTVMFIDGLRARAQRDERGATAVEYGLMVALIAGAIVITVGLLGGALNDLFASIQGTVTANTP